MPASAYREPSDDLLARLAWLRDVIGPRLERYLGYYRNPVSDLASAFPCPASATFSSRPFRQYQELGLPARVTGFRRASDGTSVQSGPLDIHRREVVIENDIAWRLNTVLEFALGRVPAISSTARDDVTRRRLNAAIHSLLRLSARAGQGEGLARLQQLVLQGAIAGSAWLQLRPTQALLDHLAARAGATATTPAEGEEPDLSRWFSLEVVEASRLCPLPQEGDTDPVIPSAAAVLLDAPAPAAPARRRTGMLERMRSWITGPASPAADISFDLFTAESWQRCVGSDVIDSGPNLLGVVPFIRYVNAPDPAAGTRVGPAGSAAVNVGMGDIEPLIGLQDELNTRLSDRAFRVTMCCFQMYLAKGIETFTKRPVGPGQLWATDNKDAKIEAFGSDTNMPSEEAHINEVREALDKISGVSPVAAGLIRGKLGNLTSAVALRLTLIALLARTERKRAALTHTLSALVRTALEILDRAGLLDTEPGERGIDVNWPTPLPESDMDRLNEAQAKLNLGVPRGVVLAELGYGELDVPETTPSAPARESTPTTTG